MAKKSNKLKIKQNRRAALPPDLFRDPETGRVMQKKDDDGIWNRRYLELRKRGLA